MIRSMTAFARVTETSRDGNWAVEIRSLNHRYLDLSIRLPPVLSSMENQVKELIQTQMHRGKVSVTLSRESETPDVKNISLNDKLIGLYLQSAKKIRKDYGIQGEIAVSDLLKIPGVLSIETQTDEPEKLWPALKRILKKALQQALESKIEEGRKLSTDIHERLHGMAQAVDRIEKLSQGKTEKVFQKLKERVQSLTQESSTDDERFYREVAFLAERSDITEELVRLKSHFELFGSRLKSNGEIGRELDFLCQEMNREVNTMGSKSQFFEISTEVVFMKGELEKIREQVQNIE